MSTVDKFAELTAQKAVADDKKWEEAEARDEKRQEADEKRWKEADERDAKREAKRDEEFDKLASATKISMETGTLALTTANQANQKGDFVIKEIEKTNKKVDRLEKFEKFVMKGRGKQLFRLNGDMSNGK